MAQGDQQAAAPAGDTDVLQAALTGISDSLARRGYLTTEWWTTVIGGALSAVLALVHVGGSSATHVVAVAAPAVLAALYAITRTVHKSALASALGAVLPQALAAGGGSAQDAQSEQTVASGQPITAVTQTDSSFAFGGIPPIRVQDETVGQPVAAGTETDSSFVFGGIPPVEDANA